MIDQHADGRRFDPGHKSQKLMVLSLDLQKHVEFREPGDQIAGVLVVIYAMKCRIERRAEDSLVFQFLQRREIGIKRNDCNTLQVSATSRDRVEHA